jgi:hypothetical protein
MRLPYFLFGLLVGILWTPARGHAMLRRLRGGPAIAIDAILRMRLSGAEIG